ncbi:hypothetical protein Cst_c09390 [Thermoclostridium stercorarium subsp. stercorarium DSM 8532]|jgi:hypothetical protein|uniref:DUF4340 domain-containing protein n=3 Tax=Thermoclostridium stercorarium TaxID=1510 RepID=L7VMF9_THES1|nr:DUF4340 domain-containing protein [Thermoclostridium stercorarium]AGC67937.1 hypothetical protein Cst_c09390 [Thermoclostridium stercorarium subsp. stercorarium DSM 8532]AGI38973.1 hypothetical protein Clst_0899 [Thermoclostridium stercorarium subsp. stercorarium DSM 8532]ANW98341.1 hypothetical protein CSTERTH_04450 [Thermoclostridium stercorarium subsp. thermolacticum DSM 2910]ANX00868.1 hypothetical protein CSTERLE_04355 [Thermoclostridium stercorarium subsp. leptospartum DSM 9219]UZQ864
MSNFKKLIIPAIVLVLLVGVYLVVSNLPENKDEEDSSSQDKIEIFNFEKNDLAEIIMENKGEVMHFKYTTIQVEQETTKDDGTTEKKTVDRNVWVAVEPEGMNVRSSAVDSIAWNANTLKAYKIIEENPSDLSVYGLDDPVKLTFVMNDGTKYVLYVGNETPTGGAYYAKKGDEPTVYTIGDYEAEKFIQTKFDLMETDIYDKDYETTDFTALKFTRNGSLLFDAKAGEDGTKWLLSYPIEAEARYENIYKILEALAGVSVSKYVDENVDDLGKYGLASPSYIFEYTVDGKEYKLSLGKLNPDGNAYYAVLNDGNLVFTISSSAFTFLDKPVEELVSSFVHLQNINEVSEMRITMDGRVDVSRINVDTEDDDKSTYEFNGTLLTGEDDEDYIRTFKKYYQGAIGITMDKLNLDVQPVLENPEVTIEYTLKSGEKIKVDLVPDSEGVYYYAFKNDKYTGMMVRRRQLEDENKNGLRVMYPKLVEALKEREEALKAKESKSQ